MTRRYEDDVDGSSNYPFLTPGEADAASREAALRGVSAPDSVTLFLTKYVKSGGPDSLSKLDDVARDAWLRRRLKKSVPLWETAPEGYPHHVNGQRPSAEHLILAMMAYTPHPAKLGDWFDAIDMRDQGRAAVAALYVRGGPLSPYRAKGGTDA